MRPQMYLRSFTYVQTEAQYAFNLEKPIVPLRLEADYKPDGWLGPLCLNNLYYDFSGHRNFDSEWNKLKQRLRTMETTANRCDAGLPAISAALLVS